MLVAIVEKGTASTTSARPNVASVEQGTASTGSPSGNVASVGQGDAHTIRDEIIARSVMEVACAQQKVVQLQREKQGQNVAPAPPKQALVTRSQRSAWNTISRHGSTRG
jgi:uncharacterized sporulation protein YeaH/YhbH (DUF444 family)